MKGGSILPVLFAGMAPILVFALLVTGLGLGLVRWQPPMLWTAQFGTQGVGVHNRVTAISVDSTGFYAGGFVGYPFSVVSASPSNLFVSRYDLAGRQVWTRQFGDPLLSSINVVAAGADGVYVVGVLNGSGFVKEYDLNGNEVWTSQFVSSDSVATDVAVGVAGVYAVGTVYFASNASDTWFLRGYDFGGNVLWTTPSGVEPYAAAGVYVYSASNGLYVAWSLSAGPGFLRRYDFNGVLEWTRQLDSPCSPTGLSGDATGVYVKGGRTAGVGVFVSKHDFDGNLLWTRQDLLPPATSSLNVRMSANPSGAYLAIVLANGGGRIMKYDGNGGQAWSFSVQWEPYSISVGGSSLYVGGDLKTEVGRDAFLAEFDQSSSLVLFRVNPPFSFLLLSGLIAVSILSVLWLRRRGAARLGPVKTTTRYGSKRLPGDAWVLKPSWL